jgi:hypothetical protein
MKQGICKMMFAKQANNSYLPTGLFNNGWLKMLQSPLKKKYNKWSIKTHHPQLQVHKASAQHLVT